MEITNLFEAQSVGVVDYKFRDGSATKIVSMFLMCQI